MYRDIPGEEGVWYVPGEEGVWYVPGEKGCGICEVRRGVVCAR